MKDIVLILFISLFFQITNKCKKTEFSTYEECFANEILEEEIHSGGSIEDYTCCYLRQLPSYEGECLLVKNTDIPTYTELLDKAGIPHEVFACSEDELPDQSKSTSCFLLSPIKKSYCFTRSLSDLEKGDSENNNLQCCYITFNNIEECMAIDSSNIDGFKTQFIEGHMKYGYNIKNIEVICGDSNGESNNLNQDSNEDSDDSNEDPSNSDKNSSGTFAKIFSITYFILIIILFV